MTIPTFCTFCGGRKNDHGSAYCCRACGRMDSARAKKRYSHSAQEYEEDMKSLRRLRKTMIEEEQAAPVYRASSLAEAETLDKGRNYLRAIARDEVLTGAAGAVCRDSQFRAE